MARPRPIEGLDAAQPYAEAAQRIVAVRAAELAEHSRGVLDTGDIERVHDMRVASRRLRAALEIFEPCFAHRAWKSTLKDTKRLADALGERRDRDVSIAMLQDFAERMPAADRAGIASLVADEQRQQAEANEALAALVTQDWLDGLAERLRELVDGAEAAA
jgi:CHAD domain-containing protein